jgi:hypothetical protein
MLISRKSKLKVAVGISCFFFVLLILVVLFHHHGDHRFHSECPVCLAGTHVLWAEGPFDFSSSVPLEIRPVDLFLTDVYTHQAFLSFPFERAPPQMIAF